MKVMFLKDNELIVVNGKQVRFIENNGKIATEMKQTMGRQEISCLIENLLNENYKEIKI